MIFVLAELIVFLGSIFLFGYSLYLAGKHKGIIIATEIYLKLAEKENKDDA